MLQVAPHARAALHAPSHTDAQRRSIADMFADWEREGRVEQVTKALTLRYGRVIVCACGYVLGEDRFEARVAVDRDGSIWAL